MVITNWQIKVEKRNICTPRAVFGMLEGNFSCHCWGKKAAPNDTDRNIFKVTAIKKLGIFVNIVIMRVFKSFPFPNELAVSTVGRVDPTKAGLFSADFEDFVVEIHCLRKSGVAPQYSLLPEARFLIVKYNIVGTVYVLSF